MLAFALKRMVGHRGLRILAAAATALFALVTVTFTGAQASTGKRVAMVIGNSAYEHAPQLANPANDASDMAIALRSIGFTVVEGIDLTNRGMRDKIREFSSELRGAEVGMLFYAGHGLQVNGRNYLAPIDAKLQFESDLDFETIPLEFVQRQMEREVKTLLLFLDACRDNPLTRSFKSASRSGGAGKGLAEIKSAPGTLIAFSTDPNNVALDGKGRNSPFTKALLTNIDRPDIEIQTMMTDVRQEVFSDTDEQQTPWINSSLLGRFYFVPGEGTEKIAATGDTKQPASTSGGALSSAQIEKLAWDSVKDSNSPEEFEVFLSSYGRGFYGKLARLKLQRLRDKQELAEATQEVAKDTGKPEEKTEEDLKVASLEQPKAKEESTRKLEPELDPREVVLGIQQELDRLSCSPGRPDGIWGKRSQGALDKFARSAKVQLASAQPDVDLLDQLKKYDGDGCPVARGCPSGQKMNSRGQCYTPRREASATPTVQTRSARPQQVIVRQPQRQQQQVIIEEQPQPQHQQVIVQQQPGMIVQQQPGVMVQPQPQPRPNPIGGLIRLGVGVGATCILMGC